MPEFRFARRFARFCRLGSALILGCWLALAQAAELGDVAVRSFVGQPLVADIELTGMADATVPVQVKLAHPDIYRGANIAVPPVLSSVTMSVMRRDQRQFLHITSIKPVDSEHLHLFLDLNDGTRRHVRQVTLWLSPEPPPPPVAPLPVAAAPAESAPVPPPQPQPRAHVAGPAACAQVSAEQLRTCAALDYKNGLLSARIVELEEKVKQLQASIEGRVEPLAAPPAAAPARHETPPPPPRKPKKEKAPFPWLLVGGGIAFLLVVGGAVLVLLKRRKARDAAPAGPGLLSKLTSRFKRSKKPDETVVEPSIE